MSALQKQRLSTSNISAAKRLNNFLSPKNSVASSRKNFQSPSASKYSFQSSSTRRNSLNSSPAQTASNRSSGSKLEPLRLSTKSPADSKPTPEKESKSDRTDTKLHGMWDQYQDRWFDIQSKNLLPLFTELPLPGKAKSLNDLDSTKTARDTSANQTKLGRTQYKCNYLKFKELENPGLETCEGCKLKKRKGIHIGCSHFVCRECLQSHIKKQIESNKIQIKCLKSACKYQLVKAEISKYASNTEIMKKYYDLCVAKHVEKNPHQLVQCFTPDCGYVVDLLKLKQKDILNCARCKHNYCIRCHKTAHAGKPCDDN